MRDMKGLRVRAMGLGAALGLAVVLISLFSERPIFPLALVAMAGWWLLYMPRWRRRVRARARDLPTWNLRSG
jgi:hypothetical protein